VNPIQQNFAIWNGVERLKLPKTFHGVTRTFPTHKHMGVGRGAGI